MNAIFYSAIIAVAYTVGARAAALRLGIGPGNTDTVAFASFVAILFGIFAVGLFGAVVMEIVKRQPALERWAFGTIGIEIFTIFGTVVLGTSSVSYLVALSGIAALGGLWLLARRQQTRHVIPAV